MSTNITNEVVRMSFEGNDFEKKISKSLSALQKLKEHLKFGKVSDEVTENTSRMTAALETMANKAETIWARTTDKIRDAISNKIMGALREVQDMTVNQLAKGWDKYAEKTEAVATLVGQGYDMDTVNKEMAKLNRYTDETSYAFTNMVQSIGKFTAAGQSLEDANLAMQGIANWAAKSGANASKASSAMYQLSQAMGKGALKLDDYKSVQNLGMDTQEFRNQAIEAAVALGTLKDNLDGTYTVLDEDGKAIEKMTFNLNSFTNNLTEGQWLTSDVMMKVFNRYGSAIDNINKMIDEEGVSLASKAIENLEERNASLRKEFLTLEGTIDMSSEDVEKSLLKWSKVTEVTEDAVKNYMEYNKNVSEEEAKIALNKQYEKSVQEFADTFKVSSEEAKKYIHDFNKYTDQFGLDAYKMAQEAKTFKDAIDSVKDAASTQWMNVWEKIFGDYNQARQVWTKFANFLYDVLVDWLNNINDALDAWVEKGGRGILMETFSALGDIIWVIRDAITDINKALFGKTDSKKLLSITQKLHDLVFKMRDFFVELQQSRFLEHVTNFISGIRKSITRLFTAMVDGFSQTDTAIRPIGSTVVFILERITWFFNKFRKSLAITKEDVPKLTKFFGGLSRVIRLIGDTASTIFGTLFKGLFPGIGSFFDKMSDAKTSFVDFLEKAGEKMTEFSFKLRSTGYLDDLREKLEKLTTFIRSNVYPIISKFLGLIWALLKTVGGVFIWFGETVIDLVRKVPWDKLKENLKKLKETLTPLGDVVKKIGGAFKEGFGAITSSMKDFNDNDERTFFQRVLDALVAGFQAFRDRVKEAWASFKDVISEITSSSVWQKIVSFLKNSWTKLKSVFVTYVKPVLDYIWSVISGPITKILNMLREGRVKEILDLVKTAFQINTFRRMANFFKVFTEFFKDAHLAEIIRSISGVFHSISSMFNTFEGTAKEAKKAIKAWKNERIANTLLKITATLAIVIGMVFALSFISPERAKKMGEAFVMVLSVALVVISMLLAVSKAASRGTGSLLSVASVFMAIALSVVAISIVIKKMGEAIKGNPEEMILGFLGVLVTLGLIVAAIWLLIKQSNKIARGFADTKLLGLAAVIASVGVAVSLMAISMKKMGEMDAEDFWQAIAGVVIMIAALSASTWLLNVQKSQKGTMALIGLILVIKFMLIPMLRDIAKNKFDLGQALMAVFIPLLTVVGYIFAMSKMYSSEKMGFKSIATAVLALAAVMAILSYTLIPALGKASALGNGTNMILAAISLVILMASLFAAFTFIGKMNINVILKGAAGLALGSLAIGIAMAAMAAALYFNPGSGSDFLEMGLAMAAVLIALAGAMTILGSFAPAAITGATALIYLAGAIALLTGAIIAFKKYVLGESISDVVGDVTGLDVSRQEAAGQDKKVKVVQKKTGSISTDKKKTKTSEIRARNKAGEEAAIDYSEGVNKGMSSTKAKALQNGGADQLTKNMGEGLNSISNQELLKSYGVDTAELYAEGFTDYDVQKILTNAGIDTVDTYTDGITSNKAKDNTEASAEDLIDSLCGTYGLDSETVKEMLNQAGIDTADKVGTGVGEGDMTNAAQDLVDDLNEKLGQTDGASLTTGANDVLSMFTGTNGLTSALNLGNLDSTGGDLIKSLTGGMNGSLAGSFLSGAADSVLGNFVRELKVKAVNYVDEMNKPFLWVYDKFMGTDYLDTGKADRFYNALVQNFDKNRDTWLEMYYSTSALLPDAVAKKIVGNAIAGAYDVTYSEEGMERVWKFLEEEIDKVAHNGSGSGGRGSGISEITAEAEAEREKLKETLDELYRLDEKYENLKLAAEKGELTPKNLEWLNLFGQYLDDYNTYVLETGDATVKYEDIIDSIIKTQDKLKESFKETYGDEKKPIFKKTPFDALIEQFKANGNVTLDYSTGIGQSVVDGFNKGIGDGPKQTADKFFMDFDDTARDDKHFGIHSPSIWAEGIATNLIETAVATMTNLVSLFDSPMEAIKTKITDYVSQIIIETRALLDGADLELRVVPVMEVDGLHYALSALELTAPHSAGTTYNIADEIAKAYSGLNKPQNGVANQLDSLKTGMDTLNTSMKNVEAAIKENAPIIEVNNESDINTTIKKINRQSKMYGKSVVAYP